MKTFILLTLLALVATNYAAPTSDIAAIEALLDEAQLQSQLEALAQDEDDLAAIEGFLDVIKTVGSKVLPHVIRGVTGGVQEDGDDVAVIEALLEKRARAQDDDDLAAIEGFLSVLKSVGKKALPYVIRGVTGGVQEDGDDVAVIEALLEKRARAQDEDDLAAIEGFLSVLKSVGKIALPHVIRGVTGGVQEDDDDDLASIEGDDDDDELIAQLQEIMAREQKRGWLKKVKGFGKKALKYGRKGMEIYNSVTNPGEPSTPEEVAPDTDNVQAQDVALLKALLQDRANAQVNWGNIWKVTKKVAPRVLGALGKK